MGAGSDFRIGRGVRGVKTRTLIAADTHGQTGALKQALGRARYDKDTDRLIFLGDAVDGGPDSYGVIKFLLENADDILLGNHDEWFSRWVRSNGTWVGEDWVSQGGRATLASVHMAGGLGDYEVRGVLNAYLSRARNYIIEGDDLYVHAGFDTRVGLLDSTQDDLIWDREVVALAYSCHASGASDTGNQHIDGWENIYLGHTDVRCLKPNDTLPLKICNVWNIDTGAGHKGKVTVLCKETGEYWQSEKTGRSW